MTGENLLERPRIGDVSHYQRLVVEEGLAPAREEIVVDDDLLTVLAQSFDKMATDITTAASN
jgi:hypothetical protein